MARPEKGHVALGRHVSSNKEIVTQLQAGRTIEFAIATALALADGQTADLRLTSARRLAENAAVLAAQMESGVTVLNIDADLTEGKETGNADGM